MKIERMNKGNWGKVRAFFDLSTSDGFTIKGFKLIEGINGLFVSVPSQKGNDDEYYDTVWVESKQLREELNSLAIDIYNQNASMSENPTVKTEPNMGSTPEPIATGENIASDIPATTEQASSSSFSDDDIPF